MATVLSIESLGFVDDYVYDLETDDGTFSTQDGLILKNTDSCYVKFDVDKSEFPEFKDLIENDVELSEKRMQLLRSGKTPEPMIGKLVCSCNNVGTGNIQKVIDSGCTELNTLCTGKMAQEM